MAPTALELLQPLRSALVPVPAIQSDICRICHSSTNPGYSTCYQCGFDAAGLAATEVVPITMSVGGELVHHHLRNYKDGRTDDERERLSRRLAALLAVFLANHSACLGEWDYAATIPSPTRSAVTTIADRTRLLHGNVRPVLSAAPRVLRRVGGVDREVDVGGRAACHLAERLAVDGRLVLEVTPVDRRHPLPPDEVVVARLDVDWATFATGCREQHG